VGCDGCYSRGATKENAGEGDSHGIDSVVVTGSSFNTPALDRVGESVSKSKGSSRITFNSAHCRDRPLVNDQDGLADSSDGRRSLRELGRVTIYHCNRHFIVASDGWRQTQGVAASAGVGGSARDSFAAAEVVHTGEGDIEIISIIGVNVLFDEVSALESVLDRVTQS